MKGHTYSSLHLIWLFLILAVMSNNDRSFAQSNGVDISFNVATAGPLVRYVFRQQIVQSDGKIIVFGANSVVDGVTKGSIYRLEADGSLDTSFTYCSCALTVIEDAILQADGRLVVSGSDGPNGKMIRLNPDGSLDPSFVVFVSGLPFGSAGYIVEAIQPDGKIFATRRTSFQGNVAYDLYRFNADGSRDTSFPGIALAFGSPVSATISGIEFLPDGRFYLAYTAGNFSTFVSLTRREPNGSLDPTWETPNFVLSGNRPTIGGIDLTPNGDILVAGNFNTVNGVSKPHLVRLLSAGNVDLSFSPTTSLGGRSVQVLPNGKILASLNTDAAMLFRLRRYESDGTTDKTFQMDSSIETIENAWTLDANGRILFLGWTGTEPKFTRLLADGALDTSFQPNVKTPGTVRAIEPQPDGKVLLAGTFSELNGEPRQGFCRIGNSGTIDNSFDPGAGFSSPPVELKVLPNGKILAIGSFTSYDGTPTGSLIRINSDGSLDSGFVVNVTSVRGIWIQADGKILIAGGFNSVNGVNRTGVARLDANGQLDTTFNPVIGSPNMYAIIEDPDGRIMIGGGFSGVNGFNRSNFVRLMSNGDLDQSFNTTSSSLRAIIRQPDGKYLTHTPVTVSRKNTDGSDDTTFAPMTVQSSGSSSPSIDKAVLLNDGSIFVAGQFDRAGNLTRTNFIRLGPNGSLDQLFFPTAANQRVNEASLDEKGKLLIGGEFSLVDKTVSSGVVRLNIAPFRKKTPFDFNGDGRADFSVYRPSSNTWYELFYGGTAFESPIFGIAGDIPVPADYDGDGITDEAMFRPSNGNWWYLSSINNSQVNLQFGSNGDIPVPGDFDADGKADLILYRPSNFTWYRFGSVNGQTTPVNFGSPGDVPVIGDFDGDGKVDPAIFRPSLGDWWYAASSAAGQHRAVHWGATGDIPIPADYDGDGTTDLAVYRPSEGGWYVVKSSDGSFITTAFGLSEDIPVPADYDGDGMADLAVYRPSTGIWYLFQTTAGFAGVQWGVSTDLPIPGAFLP